jgi:hypothetical protein
MFSFAVGENTNGMKGVEIMGRGKNFAHKKKGHPGNLPTNGQQVKKHSREKIGDEELI